MKPSFAQRNARAKDWGRNPKKRFLHQPNLHRSHHIEIEFETDDLPPMMSSWFGVIWQFGFQGRKEVGFSIAFATWLI